MSDHSAPEDVDEHQAFHANADEYRFGARFSSGLFEALEAYEDHRETGGVTVHRQAEANQDLSF